MNRRDVLKSFATLVSATGLSVTPVSTEDVAGVEMVIFHSEHVLSNDNAARLKHYWEDACKGTSLEGTKTVIVEKGLDIEFVKRRT